MQSRIQFRSLAFLGFPDYRVGTDGSVWSRKWKGRRLKPQLTGRYLFVRLCEKGRVRSFLIATLVLEAFVGPRPPGKETCHFPDKSTNNNALSNLTWGTPIENASHRKIQGSRFGAFGEDHPRAKLTEENVLWIRRRPESVISMAKRFGVDRNQIYSILWRTAWRHV